jgi:uncharacterized metal-binding protein
MPSGKAHTALTLAALSGLVAPYAVVNLNGNIYSYVCGAIAGILITPDLDVDKGNIADTMIRRVSRPAQWAWRVFWQPYGWLVPHRHFTSHFPILGTSLRIGYIFSIINILLWVVNIFDTESIVFWWDWSFFFGLCHVDAIHFLTDISIKGKEILEGEQ